MKLSVPVCPECGLFAHGTIEQIPGTALLTEVDEDGVCDYEGETDVFWDGQETINGPGGKPLLECPNAHQWESDIDWDA